MIICLEGLIGAGKSTLGKALVSSLRNHGYDAIYYPEYVNLPLLKQYLGDMKRYAYPFQVIMLHQRFAIYRAAALYCGEDDRRIAIIDRGFDGDYAFANMQYQEGNISEDEWNIYLEIVTEQQRMISWTQLTIYLQCDLTTCLRRISHRNRSGESSYTRDYLSRLEKAYLTSLRRTPHLVINNDEELTGSFLETVIETVEREGGPLSMIGEMITVR